MLSSDVRSLVFGYFSSLNSWKSIFGLGIGKTHSNNSLTFSGWNCWLLVGQVKFRALVQSGKILLSPVVSSLIFFCFSKWRESQQVRPSRRIQFTMSNGCVKLFPDLFATATVCQLWLGKKQFSDFFEKKDQGSFVVREAWV